MSWRLSSAWCTPRLPLGRTGWCTGPAAAGWAHLEVSPSCRQLCAPWTLAALRNTAPCPGWSLSPVPPRQVRLPETTRPTGRSADWRRRWSHKCRGTEPHRCPWGTHPRLLPWCSCCRHTRSSSQSCSPCRGSWQTQRGWGWRRGCVPRGWRAQWPARRSWAVGRWREWRRVSKGQSCRTWGSPGRLKGRGVSVECVGCEAWARRSAALPGRAKFRCRCCWEGRCWTWMGCGSEGCRSGCSLAPHLERYCWKRWTEMKYLIIFWFFVLLVLVVGNIYNWMPRDDPGLR